MGWIIERGMVPVNCEIAIFDLKGALAPQDKPLMLQPVLFCPVLTWAAQELMDCGVQRYFIVCPENCRQEVLDDLPGCDVTFFDHAEAALSAAGGDVVMVPGPVVPVYGPEDGRSVYAADSQVLLARLRAGTPLTDCPAEAAGVRSLWRPQALAPAFRPFDSAAALTAAMPDARELILRRLAPWGEPVAIFGSAFLFGLFHGNFGQFFYAFAVGAVFAYVALRTGGIRYTVALHFLVNLLGMTVAQAVEDSLVLSAIYGYLILAITIAGCVILWRHRKRIHLREGTSPIPAQEKRGLFLGNSGMIAMMVLSGILMLYVAFLA